MSLLSFLRKSSHFIHLSYAHYSFLLFHSPSATRGTRTRENSTFLWTHKQLLLEYKVLEQQLSSITSPCYKANTHISRMWSLWADLTRPIMYGFTTVKIIVSVSFCGRQQRAASFTPKAWRRKADEEGKQTYSCCWHKGPEGRSHSVSTLLTYSVHSAAAPGCPMSWDPGLSDNCLVNPCK